MILEEPFPPDVRVENEAQTLAGAGHRVDIISVAFGPEPKFEQYSPGVFVHRWHVHRQLFKKLRGTVLRFPIYARWWKRFASRLFYAHRIDTVHVHDLPLASVGLSLCRRFRIPFVLDLHENYPAALKVWPHTKKFLGGYFYSAPLWEEYERSMVREADRIIVVVEESRDRLSTIVDPSKIVVLPNTLNLTTVPEFTEGRPKTAEEFSILYFGGFGPHRGLATAIRAMVPVMRQISSAKLYLVGDGSDRQDLMRLANDLSLEKNVEFCGWTPFVEAVREYLAPSDVCLIPAESNEHTQTTIPHKLFQYMYFEKPVVVSDCRPLKRIVKETNCGVVFPAGDSEALGQAIITLHNSPPLRKRLGKNGRKAVMKVYNWSRTSRKLVGLYQQIEDDLKRQINGG